MRFPIISRSSAQLSAAVLLVATLPAVAADERAPVKLTPRARQIHDAGFLFDGHNDLPWAIRELGLPSFSELDLRSHQSGLHTDIPRLRAGGVKAQFWSVYVPADTADTGQALLQTMQQIDLVHEMVRTYPDVFSLAETADELESQVKSGRIAGMLGIEGGYSIEEDPANIERFYRRGCRYMTLTHSKSLSWADSCSDDPRCGGLSDFGRDVIREMNRVGMLVDLSHVSPECMRQALRATRAPVIFSHSSAKAICGHPRNVPDDVLKLTQANGGVVMVNFFSRFVLPTEVTDRNETARGTIHDVIDHIDHIARTAGYEHVGLGSDFDGVPRLPEQLEDVSTYPLITQALMDRGWSEDRIHGLLGGNVMRVLRAAESVSAEMQAE